MQNTNRTQKGILTLLALAAISLSFSLLFFAPQQAYAKSYAMPKVDIQAEVANNANLNVVEQRTFSFDGSFTAVWWTFSGLPEDASLKVNGVSITRVDSSGQPLGETQQLAEEPFALSWRDAGGPGKDSYSVDSPFDTVYVFFNANDENLLVTFDYTIVNGVQVYKDVGDLYWQYVSSKWEEASDDVSMTLTLPLPDDKASIADDDIRAWGHGPLDGTVTINEDKTISYSVSHVNAGQFAEARVVFPSPWLTGYSAQTINQKSMMSQNHLDSVLKEEQAWSDESNRTRTFSLLFVIGCALIVLSALVWAIVMYFRYGKEYEPDFTDEYWRDIPSPQDHPTVIARLWRWNKESNDDFTATLMYLSHVGAIMINKGSYEKSGIFGSKKLVDDYYLTRVPAVANTLTNPIDQQALHFLFDKIAGGADSLWFASIQQYGENNPEDFIAEMKAWQGLVSSETNKRDFFEFKSQRKQMQMVGVAIILVVVSGFVAAFTGNFIPLICAVPVAIVLFVIANYMPRRSREGNNLDAKSKALKNWLKDFSALDERPPTDVRVWGQFMVYAFIFGIAKQVVKTLQLKVPELFQSDSSMMATGYVPWWFWYSASYGTNGAIVPSASDMFQSSVSNTIQTAQAALSGASGNFSGGGGFGGGFSGGGGGGFGGGGGAR